MRVEIEPSLAKGTVSAPTSKSIAHRMLIAAALAEGKSELYGIRECQDVSATVDCLRALGAKIEIDKKSGTYTVYGVDITNAAPTSKLFANESGSTLRFLIPIASLTGKSVEFCGAKRLMERPLSVYEKIYADSGYTFRREGNSLTVEGKIPSGEYVIPGDISSQFITGLIFALPLAGKSSTIKIIPPFESRSYVEMTLAAVREFGIHAKFLDQFTIGIESGRYRPRSLSVEGDYSGSAFIEALNLFGGEVTVKGLLPCSLQGDRVYREHFLSLNRGFAKIDISDCPDLGPILFAVAVAKFGGEFIGTARLKIKESDRASAMKEELSKLGALVEVYDDKVIIKKQELKSPSVPISSHNDHRIVMSMAVLLTLVGGCIEGASAIDKSYPDFFRHLQMLGIKVKIENEAE